MNWGSCTGPTHQPDNGAHAYTLYISVTGIDRPHKAYEVWGGFATEGDSTPDAWSFDPAGCQSQTPALVSVQPRPADRKECLPLDGGASRLKFTVVRKSPIAPYGRMQFIVANAYPDSLVRPDPKQRYLVARIEFDHAASVRGAAAADSSCGGFEQRILFRAQPDRCNFLAADGTNVPIECGKGEVLATFGGPAETAATAKPHLK